MKFPEWELLLKQEGNRTEAHEAPWFRLHLTVTTHVLSLSRTHSRISKAPTLGLVPGQERPQGQDGALLSSVPAQTDLAASQAWPTQNASGQEMPAPGGSSGTPFHPPTPQLPPLRLSPDPAPQPPVNTPRF